MVTETASPRKLTTEQAYALTKTTLDIVNADCERAIMSGDRAEVARCRVERVQLWDELDRLEEVMAAEAEDEGGYHHDQAYRYGGTEQHI